jgi:hypothetical protein
VIKALGQTADHLAVRGQPPRTAAAGSVVTVAALVKLRSGTTGVQSALATLAIFCGSLGGLTAVAFLLLPHDWPNQRYSR